MSTGDQGPPPQIPPPPGSGWGNPPAGDPSRPPGAPVAGTTVAWPAAPPSTWPTTPPSGKLRLGWLWITLAVLVVLGVVMAAGIGVYVGAVKEPNEAVYDFLDDIDDGNFAGAYDRLCAEDRERIDPERSRVAMQALSNDMQSYSAFVFDPSGDRRATMITITDFDGSSATYEAAMVKEGGEWRVCDFDALENEF